MVRCVPMCNCVCDMCGYVSLCVPMYDLTVCGYNWLCKFVYDYIYDDV